MSDQRTATLRLSVIVPSWKDHANLVRTIPALVELNALHEVIVVDASPNTATAEAVTAAGALYLRATQPNRGAQMNLAAESARGEVLIFHHADSIMTAAHVAAIQQALRDPAVIGGAFYRKFDARHPRLLWLETVARFFTRHGGSFFGDQSVFVRQETFRALGGFAPIPLMEDMEFSRRLRRAGRVTVLDPPLESSTRRHLRRGAWRTSLQNGLFILLYKCGLSPRHLHRWYYREQLAAPNESVLVPQSVEELSRR
ncbi:MAG: TIGR04283 family arsenosugar biosynthesis glycosyltransferase [Chthoniobacterales bacterium]|nr:TIGR04283 family arsenosugar biosynthesis glycosyltransferase [Chthoniobacterales bacterium]